MDNSQFKTDKARFVIPKILKSQIEEIDYALAQGGTSLCLDFTNCERITVEGLEWLEELLLRADSAKTIIALENPSSSVYKVFKVARIESVLKSCGGMSASGPVC